MRTPRPQHDLTRRDFLRGAALAALGAVALPSCQPLPPEPSQSPRARTARKAPRVTAPPKQITGIFLYWSKPMLDDGPTQWDARLASLKGLGMDTVITQFSVIGDRAWYASDHLSPAKEGVDPTGLLLEAAARAGFKVHVGLATDERWWTVPNHPEELAAYAVEEPARNNRITRELVARYRGHPALAGIYTSHEIHLGQEGLQLTRDRIPALAEFCNRLIDESKQLAPELIVSNAPFFSLPGTVDEFRAMWRDLLSMTRFDLMMLQDGVGCERHITTENMIPYYAAMAQACRDTGVELWTDLELFDLNPPHTVTPQRLRAQLAGEAPYVSKVVAYSLQNLTPELVTGLPEL